MNFRKKQNWQQLYMGICNNCPLQYNIMREKYPDGVRQSCRERNIQMERQNYTHTKAIPTLTTAGQRQQCPLIRGRQGDRWVGRVWWGRVYPQCPSSRSSKHGSCVASLPCRWSLGLCEERGEKMLLNGSNMGWKENMFVLAIHDLQIYKYHDTVVIHLLVFLIIQYIGVSVLPVSGVVSKCVRDLEMWRQRVWRREARVGVEEALLGHTVPFTYRE